MPMDTILVEDKNRNPVLLFQNKWAIRHLLERNENLAVRETSL
jgi:peptide chain release factor 3